MRYRRVGFTVVFLLASVAFAILPQVGSSSSRKPPVLYLTSSDNGHHVTAAVGQQIQLTLATVGPGSYGPAQVSSGAVEFENNALGLPLNPGGPTQIYMFRAATQGEASIEIADPVQKRNFSVIIQIEDKGELSPLGTVDQSNDAPWTNSWTNLVNNVRQTFTPSLPKLTRVEVELAVANPGKAPDEITLMVLDTQDNLLTEVSKSVSVSDCSHVSFVLPNGGLNVAPGKVYSIRVIGGMLLGWKYVEGGYPKGSATFNGKPLLANHRSTFLFRTYGEK
jgi:hypothetical protein